MIIFFIYSLFYEILISGNFKTIDIIIHLFPLATGVNYIYLAKKQKSNLLTNLSLISSLLILLGVIFSILIYLFWASKGWSGSIFEIILNNVEIYLIISLISFSLVIIGLFKIEKNL